MDRPDRARGQMSSNTWMAALRSRASASTNPSRSLPDLAQSWAFAHVQVALPQAAIPCSAAWRPTRRGISRGCSVRAGSRSGAPICCSWFPPTKRAGSAASAARTHRPHSTRPHGTRASTEPVDLPVYYQSRFVTNSMEDLETQLRRLRALTAEEIDSGGRVAGSIRRAAGILPRLYASRREVRDPGRPASAGLAGGGARNRPRAHRPDDCNAARGDQGRVGQRSCRRTRSARRVSALRMALPPRDIRVARAREPTATGSTSSISTSNSGMPPDSARKRSGAIRNIFAKRCWEQYEEIVEANRRLVRSQCCRGAGRSRVPEACREASVRHTAGPRRTDPALRQAAAGGVIVDDLRKHGAPSSFASRGLRRICAKRMMTVDVPGQGLVRIAPVPAIPGDTTSDPCGAAAAAAAGRLASTMRCWRARASPRRLRARVAGFCSPSGSRTRCRPAGSAFASRPSSRRMVGAAERHAQRLPRAKADFTIGGRLPAEQSEITPSLPLAGDRGAIVEPYARVRRRRASWPMHRASRRTPSPSSRRTAASSKPSWLAPTTR